MTSDCKHIGRFDLVGIAPAPRGVPQIEVTFDIDANGVLNVTAKDLGTGKSQSIVITNSSGLDNSEIDRMVKEAEQYREEDSKRREAVDVKNSAENLLFNTRKSLNDYKEKLSEQEISDLEEAMKHFEEVIQSDDTEKIKSETETFMQKRRSSVKLSIKISRHKIQRRRQQRQQRVQLQARLLQKKLMKM